jgi:hypothetical protein
MEISAYCPLLGRVFHAYLRHSNAPSGQRGNENIAVQSAPRALAARV